MRRALLFTSVALLFLLDLAARACVITSISPAQGSAGSTVTLTGSGFSSVSSVGFQSFTGGGSTASFTVLSDTEMTAIVPNMTHGPSQWSSAIFVNTTSGMTVTLDSSSVVVGPGQSETTGASKVVYVEASGTAINSGGANLYFLESGATLSAGSGGSNAAWAAPGAQVSGGITATQVAGMSPSVISKQFEFLPPPPIVTTGTASNITFSSAVVSGTVNPENQTTTASYQYGTSTSYGSTTGPTYVFLNTAGVTNTLTNLQPNTLYHYQLMAYYSTPNGNITIYGADQTFTTAPLPGTAPGIAVNPVAGVTCTSAKLSAVVNPNGSATSVYFAYGLSGTYGTTTAIQSSGSGTASVTQAVAITNLQPNTTYHFSAIATSPTGTTTGSDQVFQTGAVGVSGFLPAQGPVGSIVTLYGTGFTNTTGVVFANQSAVSASASFTVLSDSTMQVTVPNMGIRYGGVYITVITTQGVTVTLDSSADIVTNGSTDVAQGNSTVYVEAGGDEASLGGGSMTYFVKSGGLLSGNGGGETTYAEPGAVITMPNISPVITPVIAQSPVATLFQFAPPGPVVTTGSATNTGFTGATANGTVDPEGADTTVYFQYGTDSTYGQQTTTQDMGSSLGVFSPQQITALFTGLTPGIPYHYRLVANNSGGTGYGQDQVFTTGSLAGGYPGVINRPLSGLTISGVTINGVVNPNGSDVSATVQYGTSSTYGYASTPKDLGSGTTDVPFQGTLGQLQPDTTYHYRIVVTNSVGSTIGTDGTFATGAVGISGFSPAQAAEGATLMLNGAGFTGATNVTFSGFGTSGTAGFVVLSDTQMAVTVPACGIRSGGYNIILQTSAGTTVTLDPSANIVGNGQYDDPSGSALVYVEGGGEVYNYGAGSDVYFLENGGVLNGMFAGGGNVAYAAPGATISLAGVTTIQVPNLDQSPVSSLFQYMAPAFAFTGAPFNIANTAATVSGTANAEGTTTTACIQYGVVSGGNSPSIAVASEEQPATDPNYPNQTPSVAVGSGTADVPLSVNLSTLLSNTSYHYRVAVTNSAGTIYGADQQFTTALGPIDYWKQTYFSSQLSNISVSGDTANPAGDGVPNLMKYALGMDPTVNSQAGLPVFGMVTTDGTTYYTFTFSELDSDTDITYQPVWSSDLSSWSGAGLIQQVLSDNGTVQQVQVSIPAGVGNGLYFKLNVTRQ